MRPKMGIISEYLKKYRAEKAGYVRYFNKKVTHCIFIETNNNEVCKYSLTKWQLMHLIVSVVLWN